MPYNPDFTKGVNFDLHLKPIIEGQIPLPNFKPDDPLRVISNIACTGRSLEPRWGYAKLSGLPRWAMFFLSGAGMGSPPHIYGGGGYVFIYDSPDPIVGTFAICRHEGVSEPGANPSRGWHPAHCAKCGIDLTIDSSD